jgi:dTDP-4-dehydrorhamnose 3,5-epimerase
MRGVSWGTIADVECVPLTLHTDDRGSLVEIVRRSGAPGVHSVVGRFGQVYLVESPARGTIRAFHKHRALWDYFFISQGSAKFLLVDDRAESKTRHTMQEFVLSRLSPRVLVVPPGIYHGWMSLEDHTQLVSVASEVYDPEAPDEERISPDAFGDVWTVRGR